MSNLFEAAGIPTAVVTTSEYPVWDIGDFCDIYIGKQDREYYGRFIIDSVDQTPVGVLVMHGFGGAREDAVFRQAGHVPLHIEFHAVQAGSWFPPSGTGYWSWFTTIPADMGTVSSHAFRQFVENKIDEMGSKRKETLTKLVNQTKRMQSWSASDYQRYTDMKATAWSALGESMFAWGDMREKLIVHGGNLMDRIHNTFIWHDDFAPDRIHFDKNRYDYEVSECDQMSLCFLDLRMDPLHEAVLKLDPPSDYLTGLYATYRLLGINIDNIWGKAA
jgi:hypothetical protein